MRIASFFRPLLSLLLVCVAVVVVGCSDASQVKAPTYSAEQIAQIESASEKIVALRDRFPELATSIEERDWNNVKSFIHGPLGEIRTRMSGLSRQLFSGAQEQALAASKEVFVHLNKIDEAAGNQDYQTAIRNYAEAIKDFDVFSNLIPKA
jgi:photosystem II protein PsbQ